MVLHATSGDREYFHLLGGVTNHEEFAQFPGGEYKCVPVQTQDLFSSFCDQYCSLHVVKN